MQFLFKVFLFSFFYFLCDIWYAVVSGPRQAELNSSSSSSNSCQHPQAIGLARAEGIPLHRRRQLFNPILLRILPATLPYSSSVPVRIWPPGESYRTCFPFIHSFIYELLLPLLDSPLSLSWSADVPKERGAKKGSAGSCLPLPIGSWHWAVVRVASCCLSLHFYVFFPL